MRINELRIYGFKSFANKTTIRFDDNFVGIVGPNGSGKSNIIDAIRWVFGEQSSKSLRGNASVDVIFGGTEKRKKQNFAEVTLVLDNKDNHLPLEYDEVSITRRLYRSGDSEYLLNGVDCRLRDITELMMDSGMGKSSFSIISQGKIEEIVVSKPDARRQVVEEAAGVIKYKKRKEKAVRKLLKTEENLKQVDLILNEMEERLGPLEKQREKALKYQTLKEDLEQKEITYLANKIHYSKEEYDGYNEINLELEKEQVKLITRISTLDTDLFTLEEESATKSQELNQSMIRVTEKQKEITSLEADYKILQERKIAVAENEEEHKILQLKNEIFNLQQTIDNNNLEISNNIKIHEQAKEEFNNLENEVSELRQERFSIKERLKEIKEIEDSGQYPYAVNKVVNNQNFSESKVVRDVFNVDAKYADAINVALGGRINEIILSDVNTIKSAIKFLKENRFGRATFIPINDVKEYYVDDKVLDIVKANNGFIGIANELIEYDGIYNKVFKNMLATTLVIDSVDNANNIAHQIKNRYRIVTLTGEIISTTGTISGGQSKKVNPLMNSQNKSQLEKQELKIEEKYQSAIIRIQEAEKRYHETRVEYNLFNDKNEQIKSELELKKYELNEIDSTSTDSEDDVDINQKITELQAQLVKDVQTKEELNVEYEKIKSKKQDFSYEIRELNEEEKEINKKLNDNKIALSRLEVMLENAINTLSEEYSLSYELAYQKADKNIDIEIYNEDVVKIKREIKALGIVNIAAIEEYEEIKTRFDFIDVQKNDLVAAKEKLEGIMNTLDEFVITQFEQVFNKLRKEFQIIFKELFGGGQADLVLTNPDDLLTTGVEIIAQPPGKKLQTISLLSGGEKALTAISLLFAILRIRTVPFAILDEVEAALDEANVKRYANYIKVFSGSTQFLVITHRQGTMELVDNLYGITMAEKGVSSVVEVKLNEEGEVNV